MDPKEQPDPSVNTPAVDGEPEDSEGASYGGDPVEERKDEVQQMTTAGEVDNRPNEDGETREGDAENESANPSRAVGF